MTSIYYQLLAKYNAEVDTTYTILAGLDLTICYRNDTCSKYFVSFEIEKKNKM